MRGAKLGVGFDVKGDTNPTALVKARGPWQIIANPTRPHDISPRVRGRGKARGGKRAIVTPAGPRRRHGDDQERRRLKRAIRAISVTELKRPDRGWRRGYSSSTPPKRWSEAPCALSQISACSVSGASFFANAQNFAE